MHSGILCTCSLPCGGVLGSLEYSWLQNEGCPGEVELCPEHSSSFCLLGGCSQAQGVMGKHTEMKALHGDSSLMNTGNC